VNLQKQMFAILREETAPARIVERNERTPRPGPKDAWPRR